jgi:hypothetical protein
VYLIPGTAFEQTESMGVMESGALAWDGETTEDRLGQQTGRLGDIDGDGLDDFVMSAMRNQENGVGPAGDEFRGSGKTYVILGADVASMEPGSIGSVADAAAAWVGENGGDAIGYAAVRGGDALAVGCLGPVRAGWNDHAGYFVGTFIRGNVINGLGCELGGQINANGRPQQQGAAADPPRRRWR